MYFEYIQRHSNVLLQFVLVFVCNSSRAGYAYAWASINSLRPSDAYMRR